MLTIDGRSTSVQGSVLDACRRVGADVPAFCHDDRLKPTGRCRACLVEIDGRVVAACTTPARAGQDVLTRTPRLCDYRRDLGELMRSEATPAGEVQRVLESLGVTGERYSAHNRERRDTTHPHIHLNLQRCITCRNACRRVRKSRAASCMRWWVVAPRRS
jgi:formate dehydrogenase major subunit